MRFYSFFISLVLFFCFPYNPAYSIPQYIPNNKQFKSIFSDIKNGHYQGTANGVLFIEKENKPPEILDFQGSIASLELIEDKEEVYDVSFKLYRGFTTSGKTKIEYRTYAYANELTVILSDGTYQLGFIDGACDGVIDGINYYYQHETGTEYLVLQITKPIILDNSWPLIKKGDIWGIDDPRYKRKTIKLMPNSVIVFAIRSVKFD